MGLLTSLADAAAAIYGFNEGIQDVKDVGSNALDLSRTLGEEVATRSRFKPFAISSSGGSGGVSSEGGTTSLNLTPQAQQIQDQLRTQSQNLFSMAGADTSGREAEIFNKIEALLNPARERDRLGLEERLFRQGRSGVTTSAFGGTPEALAMEKAIEESRNDSAVRAIDLAKNQQLQNANIGNALFQNSMAPENQLLKLLQGGAGIADIASTADRQGAQLFAGLAEAGLQSKVGAEGVAAGLQKQQLAAITDVLLGGGVGANETPGLIQEIIDLFS